MMKTESVSRELVHNGLPMRRRENPVEGGEAFGTLLEIKNSMAAQVSTFQEALPGPICSLGCSNVSALGVVDSGKASVMYQKNADPNQPAASVPATPEAGTSINWERGSPSAPEVKEAVILPRTERPSPPQSTGGLSQVWSGIKNFFVRIFSAQGSSASNPQPVARKEAAETPSKTTVAGFFRELASVLSFGLYRPEERQESGKAPANTVTKASNAGVDMTERDSHANGSPRQHLTTDWGGSTEPLVGKTTKRPALKVPPKIQEAIQQAARKYELSADLITAIIKVESNFNAAAVSREGAGGLMQLMPSTAKALKVRNRFDVQQNIDGGSRYLKSLLDRFGGRVELALAAYNVGPQAVERYEGVPPFRRTRHYVKEVLAHC